MLAELASSTGGAARWMRVAVRPAKPLMFASVGSVPVLALPGNPASAFVSYQLFARPAVEVLGGDREAVSRHRFTATASTDFARAGDGRLHLSCPSSPRSRPAACRSGRRAGEAVTTLAATAAANAYAELPDGPTLPAGALVECSWVAGAGGARVGAASEVVGAAVADRVGSAFRC